MTVDNIRLLRGLPLFSELSPQELMLVLMASHSQWHGKGDLIIREGSDGDALYVIKSGKVRITKYDGRGVERDLAILSDGEHFGELALVDDSPRSASVYAKVECEVLRVPRGELDNLFRNHREIERKFFKAFTRILAERLRKLNENYTFSQEMEDLIDEAEKGECKT